MGREEEERQRQQREVEDRQRQIREEEDRQLQRREEDARQRQRQEELRVQERQKEEVLRHQGQNQLEPARSGQAAYSQHHSQSIQFEELSTNGDGGCGFVSLRAAMGTGDSGALGPFGLFSQNQFAQGMMGPPSQLQLILPTDVVKGKLAPKGQLGEVAHGCNVQIDLAEEVSPNALRVLLSGNCVSNALAALELQSRIFFATC